MVADANYVSETDIKIRFNNLCEQFANNPKYLSQSLDPRIPEDEDISTQMILNNKRYEAAFYQAPPDSAAFVKKMLPILLSKYTEEQIANPDEETLLGMNKILLEQMSKKSVWFMIDESYGKYGIIIYYDNKYNKSNGEDL